MKDTRRIKAKVGYHDIETGFWGLTDQDGNKWVPVNMPEQLKVQNEMVRCTIRIMDDVVSVQMWGTPVKIISFETP